MPDDQASSSSSHPALGNKATDRLNLAVNPDPAAASDPRNWQPLSPEALQAMLPGYEVQQFIARGGMGAVYRGVQTSLGRSVAIKILPPVLRDDEPHFAERFKQEARSMAQLNHPGIVAVYDFGELPDGTLYFIMEFIDGTDVGQMVAQQGRLPSAHAMAITAHVCDALQYAHEHGVVHRDIKPANIMVGYDGRVKVADFGLAKNTLQSGTSLTQSGHVMGTPHFVAPEALTLGLSIDHRADIYAVGVTLYQMLTGKLPQGLFEMPSFQVPGLDPRYDAIIASAMREDREQRFQHIADMRRALDAILTQPVAKSEVANQNLPPTAITRSAQPSHPAGQPYRPPQRRAPVPTPKRKSSAGWISTAVIVTALVAGYAWMQHTGSTSSAPSGATKEKPFVNTLGMKFVPVPGTGVLFCIHETRYKDYAAYAAEVQGIDTSWKDQSGGGRTPEANSGGGFTPEGDTQDHPVIRVNWDDANSFCAWLSRKEGKTYRLPTDREWSVAVGLDEKWDRDTTSETVVKSMTDYPWGKTWPPPPGSGNFADQSAKARVPQRTDLYLDTYDDGFPTTAPVMSFKPNQFGLYDMAGNVLEWCEDLGPKPKEVSWETRTMRSSAWHHSIDQGLMSSHREWVGNQFRGDTFGFRCVLVSP